MGALDDCCMYFCTGISVFGVIGLFFMGVVLSMGGEWYLGVSEENAGAASSACYIAACIYGVYLVTCGLRISKAHAKRNERELLVDEPYSGV